MPIKLSNRSGFSGILLLFIMLLIIIGVISVGNFGYIAYQQQQNVYPTPTSVPGQSQTPVTANGSFTKDKYTVNVTLNFSLEGGVVTGTFTGACDGNISGNYDGQNGGVISGRAVGSCDPFVVPVPASATFTGNVNQTQKTVFITGNGSAAGFSGSGSLNLSY